MIGNFAFNEEGCANHIVVEMMWTPSGEMARVLSPHHVVEALAQLEVGV